MKHPFAQGVVLVVAATVLALASNAMAPRQRRLVLPGYYPGALKVPARVVESGGQAPSPVRTGEAPVLHQSETSGATTGGAPPILAAPVVSTPPSKPKPKTEPKPAVVNIAERFKPHPDKAYVEIGGDDVALLHKSGALFLDARRTSVYEEGHIAGSRPFSVWESDIDEKVNKLFEERSDPQQQLQPIVIYCSGGACEDSHMLAQKLWGIQFNNVYVYKDGFPDWQKRGGAVRTGSAR